MRPNTHPLPQISRIFRLFTLQSPQVTHSACLVSFVVRSLLTRLPSQEHLRWQQPKKPLSLSPHLLLRYLSILFLNISTLLACTRSVDHLSRTLMVLWENEYFLTYHLLCSFTSVKSALFLLSGFPQSWKSMETNLVMEKSWKMGRKNKVMEIKKIS